MLGTVRQVGRCIGGGSWNFVLIPPLEDVLENYLNVQQSTTLILEVYYEPADVSCISYSRSFQLSYRPSPSSAPERHHCENRRDLCFRESFRRYDQVFRRGKFCRGDRSIS